MKSTDELNALKEKVDNTNDKFDELGDEKLGQVSGGACDSSSSEPDNEKKWQSLHQAVYE